MPQESRRHPDLRLRQLSPNRRRRHLGIADKWWIDIGPVPVGPWITYRCELSVDNSINQRAPSDGMVTLVALDDSEPSLEAFEFSLETRLDDEIVVLHVINPIEGIVGDDVYAYDQVIEAKEAEAEELFGEVRKMAHEYEIDLRTETRVGQPAREIVQFAEEHSIDHIVMGSHGRSGLSRTLLGSVAEHVVRRASVPVTVVR